MIGCCQYEIQSCLIPWYYWFCVRKLHRRPYNPVETNLGRQSHADSKILRSQLNALYADILASYVTRAPTVFYHVWLHCHIMIQIPLNYFLQWASTAIRKVSMLSCTGPVVFHMAKTIWSKEKLAEKYASVNHDNSGNLFILPLYWKSLLYHPCAWITRNNHSQLSQKAAIAVLRRPGFSVYIMTLMCRKQI